MVQELKPKVRKGCPNCRKAELEDVSGHIFDNGYYLECPNCGYSKTIVYDADGSTIVYEYYPPPE